MLPFLMKQVKFSSTIRIAETKIGNFQLVLTWQIEFFNRPQ